MKNLITLLMVAACAVTTTATAAVYSTEVTMSLQKDEGTYKVTARVSEVVEQDGQLIERLIAAPRIDSAPGVPASLSLGPDHGNKENVTTDVTWPYPNEAGIAFCAITVKRDDKIVSMSKFQLQVTGPGRNPLNITVREIDPTSVRVSDEKPEAYVLLKFNGKTKEEVKKLAIENYGNKVRILDLQGGVTEGGHSFGTYLETGMSVRYDNKTEAEHVASILRGAHPK